MSEKQPLQTPGGPIGQYYLLDKIAQGGMAEIYKGLAYDLHGIRRTVVIKKILPHVAAHREFIDMLVTEAKLAVQLSHGNIAQVYDLGKVGDDYFMVMEYVDGKSVSQIMRRAAQLGETIPISIAIHIAAEAAAGLHYMHSRTDNNGEPLNIIHRDVSPQNLMITEGGTVKIIDFGIAKAASSIEITDVGVVKGKFAYMSPEQASGTPLDSRSDIFSLGIVLFEMLTGRRLFKAKDNQETLRNVRRANVPRPSLYRSETPENLETIILKALSKQREDRYQTGGALRDALVQCLYTVDPSFQNADVERYLDHLFSAETTDSSEEESQTPLLIIDRTQSAILAPAEQPGAQEPPPPQTDDALQFNDHSEWTPVITGIHLNKRRQRIMIAVIASVFIVVLALAFGIWRNYNSRHQIIAIKAPTQQLPGTGTETVTLPETPIIKPPPPPPAEPFGDVVIESTPSGAEIYMDDKSLNVTTPYTLKHLPAESHHRIGLLLKGYKFWDVPVSIHAGGVERLNASLEMNYASLEIITHPAGASVIINGEHVGETPFHEDKIPSGKILDIVIQKPGYLPWQTRLKTEEGHLSELHRNLEHDPKALERPTVIEPSTPPPTVLPHAN
ncbi:MAG: hypothetical protein COV45_02585 [Deltaproteobacteria bacterium CG11_big_fil_rev_8_21_14_0_20_47_16]|nr:MAG: hypothetical protein COV45_02585 [Deltaproteobacteria bacterium CG11_big_fil_rev_8_21_14_0_20_47_16]